MTVYILATKHYIACVRSHQSRKPVFPGDVGEAMISKYNAQWVIWRHNRPRFGYSLGLARRVQR